MTKYICKDANNILQTGQSIYVLIAYYANTAIILFEDYCIHVKLNLYN